MPAGDSFGSKIEAALALHRAGRFAEAEALYCEVIAVDPGRADVYHLLAVLCQQTARTAEALAYARRAAEAEPSNAAYQLSLGAHLKARGHLQEARHYLQ